MSRFQAVVWSSVGKKLLSGITGVLLFIYVCVHLLGNLTLFVSADAFNRYAHFLENFLHGSMVLVFEIGLVTVFLVHIITGVSVALLDKYRARPVGYIKRGNAGGPSQKTLSSRAMIITGSMLLIFLVIHVRSFKFGETQMIPLENGEEMMDLYSLVVLSFKNPWVTLGYVGAMVLLGSHLWHGFWSAFQSLGWTNQRWLPILQGLGVIFALALAVGFIVLPLYAYAFIDSSTLNVANRGGF